MRSLKTYILMVLTISFLHAQQTYQISGQLSSSENQQPIVGANLFLQNTNLGATTDSDGYFKIMAVPSGNYTLKVQYVGYKPISKEIKVEGGPLILDLVIEESPLQAGRIVVSATRTEKHSREVPVIVNIADEATLEMTQSTNIAEGLNFIPGVRTENNCQNCGFTQVRLNGMNGPYSQILVNSRPIFSALNGVYGLEQIPAIMVERVEVIRGGGSALFGSNAIAGVINIITKEPINTVLNFNSQQSFIAGDAHDQSYNFATSFVNDNRDLGLSIFANMRERDGYDHNGDDFTELVQLENRAIGLRSFWRPTASSKLSFDTHFLYEDRRGGNKLSLKPHQADIAEALTHKVWGGGFTYEQFFAADRMQKLALYLSTQLTNRDSYYGVGKDPNAYGKTDEKIALAGAQYSHAFVTGKQSVHEVTVGLETQYNHLDDAQPGYNRFIQQKIYQTGFYLQDDWKISNDITFLYGFRLDKHNKLSNPVFNPRSNLLINLYPQLQLRLSYASGFRAPQAFDEDLHLTNIGEQKFHVIKISKGLKPERSNSYSVSLDYSNNFIGLPWGVTLEGFYTQLTDVFVNKHVGETGKIVHLEKQNGPGALVNGVTLEGRMYPTAELELQAGITAQNSRYEKAVEWAEGKSSKQIFKTPHLYGFYLARWEALHDFDIAVSGVYTGRMQLPHFAGFITEDRLVKTKAFIETNLKLSYTLDMHTGTEAQFYFGVYNLFNQYQNDFDKGVNRDPGYVYGPNRPRTIFGGLEFSLK